MIGRPALQIRFKEMKARTVRSRAVKENCKDNDLTEKLEELRQSFEGGTSFLFFTQN